MAATGPEAEHEESTASEALQFLVVAVAAMLLVRLVHAAGEHFLAPDEHDALGRLAEPFRRGYLLTDAHTLVPDGMSLAGRAGGAVIAGMAGGALGGFIGRWVAMATARNRTRAMRLGLRIGMITVLAWCMIAALFWPPVAMRLADDRITVIERPAALSFLVLPWTKRMSEHAWSTCEAEPMTTLEGKPALMLRIDAEPHLIGPADDPGAIAPLQAFIADAVKRSNHGIIACGNARRSRSSS